ncbi:probable sulfatase atsG [Lentisphaera araneosa HTCC2155]|uniref:Probable sulfatase atsG n=1 Tax=Lentisphaera araneosa HTCC2155 TaxID=313628 RepID=A6DFB7_9BACT|nr:sulfatase [Lentisphaera araneosa]EDM29497.1 probable sulfatase atsG [Lentisphaera araneosa HTCC2155]
MKLKILLSIISIFSLHAADKPNILLILSDDQAWTDYGFMGHEHIKTPHLDKLASESIVFERGYVASPLCRPSLASMVTGLYPFDHGITGNDVDGRNKRAELDKPVQEKFNQLPSFIKMLTSQGYLAHQSGKWWEGSHKDGGFTHGMTHGNPKKGGRHGDLGLEIGRQGIQPIKDFVNIAKKENKPFFLWYAPFLPHDPHTPPKRLLEKYRKLTSKLDEAKYFAMCEWFDETCGEIISFLKEKDVYKNTLVFYICDNGWVAKSVPKGNHKASIKKAYAAQSKGSPYENGIRTPIMISWPGTITPQKSNDFAHAIDLFPTLASVINTKAPSNLPGIDLLDEKQRSERDIIFGCTNSIHNMNPNDPDETLQYLWCIKGKWKLIIRYQGLDTTNYKKVHEWDKTPIHLYDLSKDPQELNNLSDQYPDIVADLKSKIQSWHPVNQSNKQSIK